MGSKYECEKACTSSSNCDYYIYKAPSGQTPFDCFCGDFDDPNPQGSVSAFLTGNVEVNLKNTLSADQPALKTCGISKTNAYFELISFHITSLKSL